MEENSSCVNRVVYQFWTDTNPVPPARQACLRSSANFGVPTVFVTPENLSQYVLPESPLHPAYPYLSLLHRSDYLRCYFMHHHGGGYADIKSYSKDNNWRECFDLIERDPRIMIVGQPEIMYGSPYSSLNSDCHLDKLTACCYFIVRPHSPLTTRWFGRVNQILDEKLEILRAHPAHEIRVARADYPIRWAELTGEPLHDVEFLLAFSHPGSVNRSLVSGCDLSTPWQ